MHPDHRTPLSQGDGAAAVHWGIVFDYDENCREPRSIFTAAIAVADQLLQFAKHSATPAVG